MKNGNPPNLKGRPKGALNKATREIKDAARALVEDADYREKLKRRLASGKAPHMETLLHYYAYGKPKEQMEHSGTVETVSRIVHEHRPS